MTVTSILDANALTTYATAKARLDKTGAAVVDATDQNEVERLINAVSSAIETECDRQFRKQSVTELYAPPRDCRLILARTPLDSSVTPVVTIDGVAVTDFEVEDSERGYLWRDAGWGGEDYEQTAESVAVHGAPGTAERIVSVTYTGGYVLPGDAVTAVAEGVTASATTSRFVLTTPAHPVDGGSLVVSVVASTTNIVATATWGGETMLDCTFAASAAPKTFALGVYSAADGVSTCADLVGFSLTVESAGTVATSVTYAVEAADDVVAAVTRSLPWPLEEAALVAVAILWRWRQGGYARDVMPERNTAIGRGDGGLLPDAVLPMLAPYRRWA